jgi:hypothetical protein
MDWGGRRDVGRKEGRALRCGKVGDEWERSVFELEWHVIMRGLTGVEMVTPFLGVYKIECLGLI